MPGAGEVLRELRSEKGLSQRGLARLLGVSAAFICDVEQGGRKLTLDRLEAVTEILELSREDKEKLYRSARCLPRSVHDHLLSRPDWWGIDLDTKTAYSW